MEEFDLSLMTTLITYTILEIKKSDEMKYETIDVYNYFKINGCYRIILNDFYSLSVIDVNENEYCLELIKGSEIVKNVLCVKLDNNKCYDVDYEVVKNLIEVAL